MTREQLMDAGSGLPAPNDLVALYRAAFSRYGARALWSYRADIAQPIFRTTSAS